CLLDDAAEALRRLFHASVQLRRARRDGIHAAAEALLDIVTTSPFNLSMTGPGVPFGANSAVQLEASTSLTPVSCSVGHSGLNLDRLAIVTANTRMRPDLTCGATDELASTPSGMSPPASAAAAGAPPLYGICWKRVPVLSAIHSSTI